MKKHSSLVPPLADSFVKAQNSGTTETESDNSKEEGNKDNFSLDRNANLPGETEPSKEHKESSETKTSLTEVSKKQNDDHASAGEAIRLHVKQNFSEISVEPEFEGEDVQPLAEISEDEEEQSSESDFDDGDNDDDDGANDSKASETVVMEGVAEEKAKRYRDISLKADRLILIGSSPSGFAC